MFDFATVGRSAAGRWPEIWQALGVISLPKSGRHGPCPGCGGKNRFRLLPEETDTGGWICGQGGNPTGGDGFTLLCHVHGWNKSESLKAVAAYLGVAATPQDREHVREAARKAERVRMESALVHELRVLLIVVQTRITDRELANNRKFQEARPEWRPLPGDHWERERQAAKRIGVMLEKLYQAKVRPAA